ncbi:serine hydrolase domain-containing protein [Parvularcula marina]|uniref:serine hydrolase domain-containing protein n=1 Tax=Parvularcula marina TaxID=2292771 RepID=UPI0011C018DD|nr:serine hydrolase domain-containing protein [Parvularcula marina]
MKFLKVTLVGLAAILLMALWVGFAGFVCLFGWWMKPVAPEGDADGFLAVASQMIDEESKGNAALILIEDGETAGSVFADEARDIDDMTVFPTASFSKWMAAMAIMTLVEDGLVDLDAPVSDYLTRWTLPEGEFDNDQVTVRRLLSHTSGLTDGLGFGEYTAEETIPRLEESLAHPRASRGEDVRIAVGQEPGVFAYSGGGYLILELLIEEVTGEAYADYIAQRFFVPLGMEVSTYDFLGDVPHASANYDAEGNELPHVQFASAAATGLSSSARDLSHLVKGTMRERRGFPLSPDALEEMRKPEAFVLGAPIWGLGTILYAPTRNGEDFVFGHDGANDPATNVTIRINPETRDAIIVLVTGHPRLASEIGGEWVLWQTGVPDVLSTDKALRSAVVPALAGAGIILLLVIFGARALFFRRS